MSSQPVSSNKRHERNASGDVPCLAASRARPRAALYVDGFNFYYGVTNHYRPLREERGYSLSGLAWCDFRALVERHFGFDVAFIKYFTAPVTESVETASRPGEHDRYALWRRAVETIPGLRVIEGHYVARDPDHQRPDAPLHFREEKQTDVQIAVEMLLDAERNADEFEQVLLLTGDQDQWPAVCALMLRLERPKPTGILLPPSCSQQAAQAQLKACQDRLLARHRSGESVFGPRRASVWTELLDEEKLANSLLAYEIAPDISCPEYWRLHHNYLDRLCNPQFRPDRARRAMSAS